MIYVAVQSIITFIWSDIYAEVCAHVYIAVRTCLSRGANWPSTSQLHPSLALSIGSISRIQWHTYYDHLLVSFYASKERRGNSWSEEIYEHGLSH